MNRAAICAACLVCRVALADPADGAKAHYKQGRAYQEAGELLRAADEFKAAYALDPRAELLFNIAQAYRLAGDKPDAVDYFKRYLEAQPAGKGADEARVLVAELQHEIDDARAHEPAQPQPPPPPPAPALPPPSAPAVRDTVLVRTSPALRIAGLATAGVGLVAVGIAAHYALVASSDSDYITNFTGTWGPTQMQRYLDGQAANRDMKIGYAIGGGLVAVGAGLFLWGSHLQAVPVATPQMVGVATTGRF